MLAFTEVHNVTLPQYSLVRNSVAYGFVNRPGGQNRLLCPLGEEDKYEDLRANRFRKFTVVQRGRIRASFNDSFMDDCVNFIGGDSRLDMGRRDIQNFSRKLRGRNGVSKTDTAGGNKAFRRERDALYKQPSACLVPLEIICGEVDLRSSLQRGVGLIAGASYHSFAQEN